MGGPASDLTHFFALQLHGCWELADECDFAGSPQQQHDSPRQRIAGAGLTWRFRRRANTMAAVIEPDFRSPNSDLAMQVAKLWPHREREANIILGQLCRIGLHWWRRLDLSELVPGKDIQFCFWCKKVKIDGGVHEP
jgi:hypothetical protein